MQIPSGQPLRSHLQPLLTQTGDASMKTARRAAAPAAVHAVRGVLLCAWPVAMAINRRLTAANNAGGSGP